MRRGFWPLVRKLALYGFLAFIALIGWFTWDLPGSADVNPLDIKHSITVLASDGSVIARYGGTKGDVVTVKDLPPYVPQAVIAIEDRRFYKHFGIDPIGLGRAMWVNVRARHWVQGGSTLTQQLAKNLFLTPDKTIRRKVQEALLAVWIDYKYSKDDILSSYLNRVYFGAGAYGIDAAAHVYYDKPARDLTLWQAAQLAGLLKAPSRYSPASNPDLAKQRAKLVIAAMKNQGFIDEKKAGNAAKEKVKVAGAGTTDLSRYFTDWVIDEIDSYVTSNDADLVVKTTLSVPHQKLAEKTIENMATQLGGAEKSPQMALVSLGEDGSVLAMVGGTDYAASQYNRATQAMRQPGSSFKPFVYLAALEAGYGPDDLIDDSKLKIGKYAPENYDGKYFGTVTLTDALALSLNTATIRLLQAVGINRLLDVVNRIGLPTPVKAELASGLGASESTVLDMTAAYAVIGNGGYPVWPYAVQSIEDSKGRVLYRRTKTTHARVFAENDMARLDSMMVQVVARGTGQAAQLSRGHVAGKTGTSQNYRDAWFIGYSDDIVTGVWMGKDDSTAMDKVTGGKYPARLWHDYMNPAIDTALPPFVPHFERPQVGFMSGLTSGFGGARMVGDSTGGVDPYPVQPAPDNNAPQQLGDGFNGMLNRWSNDDGGAANNNDGVVFGQPVTPDNTPAYNP